MPVDSAALAPLSDASSSIIAAWMGPDAADPDDDWTAPPHPRRAEIERLGNRIAELSVRIQAATYELLVLIREFDERSGWSGCISCAHWLSWRTSLAPGAAREHVRVARALANLPKLGDAMRRGVVSYSKVRAVTRVATPETEAAKTAQFDLLPSLQRLRDVAEYGIDDDIGALLREAGGIGYLLDERRLRKAAFGHGLVYHRKRQVRVSSPGDNRCGEG